MTGPSTHRLRALALAAVCAATLGITACGDDDDTGSTTSVPSEATGAESTGSTEIETNFTEAMSAQLEAAGIESSQVDCVIDEIESTVDESEIQAAEEELQSGGSFPQELLDASLQAAQGCLTP